MKRDDAIPDVRDGLTRLQRVILWQLSQLQHEHGGRRVSTTMLYGRVCEHVCVDPSTFQRALAKLVGRGVPSRRGTIDPRPWPVLDSHVEAVTTTASAPRGPGTRSPDKLDRRAVDRAADERAARADSAADHVSDDGAHLPKRL